MNRTIDTSTVTAVCAWLIEESDRLAERERRTRAGLPVEPCPPGTRWPWVTSAEGASAVALDLANRLAILDPAELAAAGGPRRGAP